MLHKLDKIGLVNYQIGLKSISMTAEGQKIATRMIRNTRLLEVLMNKSLQIPIDDESVCGIEHHMSQDFADALCKLLGHPRACPHGNRIPVGICCKK
jgi:DtxR family Mn-dependent transcriptional regulator